MTSIPRQSLDEVVTKYYFHPKLFDVYVEGEFDRGFLYAFLDAIGKRGDISVFAIDGVEVPESEVVACGLSSGSNKNRVLALGQLISKKLTADLLNLVCLTDADLDRLLGTTKAWPYIRYTDYTCMEMYSLNEKSLHRFLRFTCNLDDPAIAEFQTIAMQVLPVQFGLRATIQKLKLNLPTPAFLYGLNKKKDLQSFSVVKYLTYFLSQNSLSKNAEEIRAVFQDLQSELSPDLRHKANGHDYVSLLFEFAWQRGGVRLHSKDLEVEKFGARIICGVFDTEILSREPLFALLAARS